MHTPLRFAACAGLVLLSACATGPTLAPALITPPAALRVEGLPGLPQTLLPPIQRYTAVSGHGFVDWHPQRAEMLVAHRVPGASTTQLFRVAGPLAKPDALTDGKDPVSSAQYEPREGRYIVFARASGGDEAYQLYRLDPGRSEPVQITESGQRHSLIDWMRSSSLALVSSVPLDRNAVGGTRREVSTTLSLVDPVQPNTRRVLVDLPGGGWFGGRVSPDEASLAITRYVSAEESEIWRVNLIDGQRQRLLPAPGSTQAASHFVNEWARDGKALHFSSDRASEFREAMRLDLASGTVARLSAGIPWDVQGSTLSADGRWLATSVNVDGRSELRLFDAVSGEPRPLPSLPGVSGGNVTRLDFHPRLATLAVAVSSAQGPGQIHSIDMNSLGSQQWTRASLPAGMDLRGLPDQQVVRWKSFDGLTISGLLSQPPARFSGKRPVLMLVHGGPESQAQAGWMGRLNHLIQDLGVAVIEPNVRGSTGYGKTFTSLDNGRLREDSVKDMASLIDWIATQPGLDASKVIVVGGSYGGYMALAASTLLADRIAGAVSSVGISNFVSFLENTESYRRDLRRAEYGDERDPAMRAFLQSISPLSHVEKINRPLLVVQGKNDPRVPWTESEQIVRSLQSRGKPVWYLLADNEGHGFARRENAEFYFAALVQFVELTLLR